MTYSLGKKSLSNLNGVHPKLVEVVKGAIGLTTQDFGVHSGLRTASQQNVLFKRRASKLDGINKISKHQVQGDGYGHAVDLVPYISGQGLRWEWPLIYPIASAMATVAREKGVTLKWGGVWDRLMTELSNDNSPESMEQAVRLYCVRHPGPDFIDGPHYELA